MRAVRSLVLLTILTLVLTTLVPSAKGSVAAAAECSLRIGPGVPPPSSTPMGIAGFHAAYWGQSGYPTLCPGQTAKMVVAYMNSGSLGWQMGPGHAAFIGTWNPEPGQDRPSIIGGEGVEGAPNTRWRGYNRPAHPPSYVGPGQIGWFQFTVKAPQQPGTYRLHVRPLIETVRWMEDYGVYWVITVVPAGPPQRVTVSAVDTNLDTFTAGGAVFAYDRNDAFEWSDAVVTYEQFEMLLSAADVVDMRYEPTAAGVSSFNIFSDFGYAPPTVKAEVGSFDSGPTKNDVMVTITSPVPGGSSDQSRHRARVPAGTTTCEAISGPYEPAHPTDVGSYVDLNVPAGTYCYRAGARNFIAEWNAFAYSAPVTVPAP